MKGNKILAKIGCAVLAVALSVSAFMSNGVTFAKADETVKVTANNYFTVNGSTYNESKYVDVDGDGVLRIAPIKDTALVAGTGYVVETAFKNKVAVNDFETKFKIDESLEYVDVVIKSASYLANGNKVVKSTVPEEVIAYEKEVANTVRFLKTTSGYDVSLNGFQFATGVSLTDAITLRVTVAFDGVMTVIVNGTHTRSNTAPYFVECIDKTMATLGFNFAYKDNPAEMQNPKGIDFYYIDQAVSAGTHKQEFDLDANNELANVVPYITDIDVDKTGIKIDNAGKLVMVKGKYYTIKYTAYRLNTASQPASASVKVDASIADKVVLNSSSKIIGFSETGDFAFTLNESDTKVMSTYNVKVVDNDVLYAGDYATEDDYNTAMSAVAPKYDAKVGAIEAFNAKLQEATTQEYITTDENGDSKKVTTSIRVGSGKYLELPSFADLITDDINGYKDLSATVYYMNESTGTSLLSYSSLKVPVETEGKYYFFVIFKDVNGNAKSPDDFYTTDDGWKVDPIADNFVFSFEVSDTAPIVIEKGKQNVWYKGVTNTATEFNIEASEDKTVDYTLEYKVSDDRWEEIPVYEEGMAYDGEYFSLEDLKKIAYDGTMTFTPDRTGTYRITCTVNQTNVIDKASLSVDIDVREVSTVKPDDHWVENNVASFVFLGIGTLALIGVIVLLCIKPKDEEI